MNLLLLKGQLWKKKFYHSLKQHKCHITTALKIIIFKKEKQDYLQHVSPSHVCRILLWIRHETFFKGYFNLHWKKWEKNKMIFFSGPPCYPCCTELFPQSFQWEIQKGLLHHLVLCRQMVYISWTFWLKVTILHGGLSNTLLA